MQKKMYVIFTMMLIAAFAFAACSPAAEEPVVEEPVVEEPTIKVCEVTDAGGVDDKSFNASAWKGVEDAVADLGVEGKVLESQQQTDYEKNINAFLEEGCDLIVTVGFLLGDATAAAAAANPDTSFAIVDVDFWDWAVDPPVDLLFDNAAELMFQTDEAGFMAGYLAAAMTETGKVGTFGGVQIPPVTIFMDGYYYGVQYYNEVKGTAVEVLGWDPIAQIGLFTNNFESTDDGRAMGESLMDEGADIIMPVAGPVGLGTAAAVQARGNAWIIGVDADWTLTAPEYGDVILTSVLKKIDVAVYDQVNNFVDGTFSGGVTLYNLANGGVGLAQNGGIATISAELAAELADVEAGIIDGSISVSGE